MGLRRMRPKKRGLAPHLYVNVNSFGGRKKEAARLLAWAFLEKITFYR